MKQTIRSLWKPTAGMLINARRAGMTLLATLLLSMTAQTAWADGVDYIDAAGVTKNTATDDIAGNDNPAAMTNSNNNIGTEGQTTWYVVNSKVTFSSRLGLEGDVHLILADGGELEVTPYIYINPNSSLTIYSQSTGASKGKLTVSRNENECIAVYGSLTINGGDISLTSTTGCGFTIGTGVSAIINNGQVSVSGGIYGVNNDNGYLTINGGDVMITGGTYNHNCNAISDMSKYTENGGNVVLNDKGVIQTVCSYVDAAGTAKSHYAGALTNTSSTIGYQGGNTWFIVNEDVTFDRSLYIYGHVNLILADGKKLTVNSSDYGFYFTDNSSLTIYSQSHDDGKGQLSVTTSTGFSIPHQSLTINGGNISVETSGFGVYIEDGSMTVNNGDVTIKSNNNVAINKLSNYHYTGGSVTLYDYFATNPLTSYVDAAGVVQSSVQATVVASSNIGSIGQTTWYVVKDDITFTRNVTILGTVNLILADGKELTVNSSDTDYGIYLGDNSSLNIYTQSHGTSKGKLTVSSGFSGIAVGNNNLTINGGLISITSRGTTIPGISIGGSGSMTLNNGDVTVTGRNGVAIDDRSKFTQNGGLLNGFDGKVESESTNYLDAAGTSQSKTATILKSGMPSIGTAGQATWYVAKGTVNFPNKFRFTGHVNLILADGAVMTVNATNDDGIYIYENSSLTIYSQSTGSSKGKLIAQSEWDNGISINASTSSLTINGGEVTAKGEAGADGIQIRAGNMTVNSGQVTVTNLGGNSGGISFQDGGTLTLGYHSPDDFVKIDAIVNANETLGTVNIKSGQHFVADDGDAIVTGNGVAYTAVAGKKLVPCYAVTFDAGSGSFSSESTILLPAKFDTSGNAYVSAPATDPTRSGYSFGGWYNGSDQYNFTAAVTGDLTLTAHWTENVATLTEADPIAPLTAMNGKQTKVSFTRSGLTAGKYSTICLPFSFTASETCTFYKFDGVKKVGDDWVADISATTGGSADTPYIFTTDAVSVTFSNDAVAATDSYSDATAQTAVTDWTFQGTYAQISLPKDGEYNYGFAAGDGSTVAIGSFVHLVSGASAAPFRAYLKYTGTDDDWRRAASSSATLPSSIIVRIVGSNGEVTKIGTLDTHTGELSFDGWYTLTGRKLSDKPTQKGIYINNGKKIVVK